jgi:glycine hydroxymethyltransferase
MDDVMAIAKKHKPKLIIAGGTAYSRIWDWEAFRKVADEVGAYLMVDMSHIAGLVAGGAHPSPIPHAHVVTTTTHKSMRGPRSGVILWNDEELTKANGLRVVSGGTDNHSMLVDLTAKDVTGKAAETGLDRAWLTCNKNGIPYDTRSPFVTSGIRLGTPAGTTRGFGEAEFTIIGKLICEVVEGLSRNGPEGDGQIEQSVRDRVTELCDAFPVYPGR